MLWMVSPCQWYKSLHLGLCVRTNGLHSLNPCYRAFTCQSHWHMLLTPLLFPFTFLALSWWSSERDTFRMAMKWLWLGGALFPATEQGSYTGELLWRCFWARGWSQEQERNGTNLCFYKDVLWRICNSQVTQEKGRALNMACHYFPGLWKFPKRESRANEKL